MDLKQDDQMIEEPLVIADTNIDKEEFRKDLQEFDEEPYVTTNVRQLSQTEFYRHQVMGSVRTNITICSIMLYISGVSNLIATATWGHHGMLYYMDSITILALALGIHFCRSRVCAVILSVYAALNAIVGAGLGGLILIWAAALAVKGTFEFQGEWKRYKQNGSYPGVR